MRRVWPRSQPSTRPPNRSPRGFGRRLASAVPATVGRPEAAVGPAETLIGPSYHAHVTRLAAAVREPQVEDDADQHDQDQHDGPCRALRPVARLQELEHELVA